MAVEIIAAIIEKEGGIEITIEFEVTEEDYIRFNFYQLEGSKSYKKILNILRYLVPVVSAVFIYLAGTMLLKQPEIYWVVISLLFAVVWIIIYPERHKKIVKARIKRLLRKEVNSTIFGKKLMLIDQRSFVIIGERSQETILKENIKSVAIYDDMILLYLSGFIAQIIPTRYLDGNSRKFLLQALKGI